MRSAEGGKVESGKRQFQMSTAECRMRSVECRMPNAECRMPNVECRTHHVSGGQSSGHWKLESGLALGTFAAIRFDPTCTAHEETIILSPVRRARWRRLAQGRPGLSDGQRRSAHVSQPKMLAGTGPG